MLGKLIKHDIKQQLKNLLPMYLITLGLAIAVRILEVAKDTFTILNSIYGFTYAICIVALVGVVIWTIIVSVKHFYSNVLKDEGYLTNTLPVTRNQIILSKEVVSVITMILAFSVIMITIFIAFYSGFIKDFLAMINAELSLQGVDGASFLLWFVGIMAITYIATVQMCFLALMFGQMSNNNKILYAIVYGVIIYVVRQVLSTIALALDMIFNPDVMKLVFEGNQLITADAVYDYIIIVFISTIIVSIITIIAQHIISVYLANHKLNLE